MAGKTRTYSEKDLKLLWGLAAARCGFPNCRIECAVGATDKDGPVIFGKIAHIVGHSDDGPRGDLSFPHEKRDRYDNLILLCASHHDIVDGQPNTYTVLDLHRWKTEHEHWVRSSLAQEMPVIGFSELEIVCKGIIAAPVAPETTFRLTYPEEKLAKNNLTNTVRFYISMALSKAKEVEKFVGHVALMDPQFPERLKAGFVGEYNKYIREGLEGDSLFTDLMAFASGYKSSFKDQAAGLAVLVYLFEKCEVFEP